MVEDSSYMHSLFSSMLKVFGVGDIMTCDNAKDAIELLTITQARTKSRYINKVDIVITDWLMPQGSGEDLIKWIRSHEKDSIRFLPIIVTSGYTTEYVTNKCRDLGVNETLVKPISGTSLAARICSVIAKPRPFIQSEDYFGPDRRRQEMVFAGEERRKQVPKIVEVEP
tara:strand:- start:73 stop:579 length:507 start_codon:yes stop_codon:yes gene_type:complete